MKFLLEKTNRFRFYSWQFVRLNDLLGTQRIQHDLREWGETVSRRRRLGVQNYQEIQSHHELKA